MSDLLVNMAPMATHSVLVPKRKAVGPGPFGLVTVESYSANKKCLLFVGWVDKYIDSSLFELFSNLQFLHQECEFNLVWVSRLCWLCRKIHTKTKYTYNVGYLTGIIVPCFKLQFKNIYAILYSFTFYSIWMIQGPIWGKPPD